LQGALEMHVPDIDLALLEDKTVGQPVGQIQSRL
jgi:hypothetical protein